MNETTDAATIAAGIDTDLAALTAVSLALIERDNTPRLHPVTGNPDTKVVAVLTPLGRGVAERLRPELWRVDGEGGSWVPWSPARTAVRMNFIPGDLAERIAALLTADDMRAAKAYKGAE
jgi:hypothetical protein